jgi:hypothetical protein
MRRSALSSVVLSFALAGTMARDGAAQTPAQAATVTTEMDSVSLQRVRGLVEHARASGVPSEPLLAKVREGRLKRASDARIASAVAALATRLDTARAALGAEASADELVAGADALAAGASPSALRTVRSATAMRPISVPLGVLAQLLASGVPGPRAVTVIVDLLKRHVAPVQVLAYGNAVERDAAGGVPAEESALFRLRGVGTSGDGAVNAGATGPALSDPTANTMTPAGVRAGGTPRRRP